MQTHQNNPQLWVAAIHHVDPKADVRSPQGAADYMGVTMEWLERNPPALDFIGVGAI